MNQKTKYLLGLSVWFGLGLFSMILGWEHILTWVIGTYVYIAFVERYIWDEGGKKK